MITDVIGQALRSLRRKRARTLLTVSGIVVGVTLVVIVSMIARSGQAVMGRELDSMGLDGLSVSARAAVRLRQTHLRALRQMNDVKSAMPLMIVYAPVTAREQTESAVLCGIDAGAGQVIALSRLHGRLIAPGDVSAGAAVCVIDAAMAQAIFHRENAVGQTMTLTLSGVERTFTVVGVTETGSDLLQNVTGYVPGMVYLPYTSLQAISGRDYFDQIAVRTVDSASAAVTGRRIVHLLDRVSGADGAFRADDLAAQKDRIGRLAGVVTLVLTVISGISLLVSGMGIMNVMLSSVTERTREIGVKKALGASGRRILLEFLTEAAAITFLGSVTGVALGGGIACAGLWLVGAPVTPSPAGGALLIGFCLLIGGVFGVYPALKAARLDPVVALRAE